MSNNVNPCYGDEYKFYDLNRWEWVVRTVDWEWFHCTQTKKCIHINNRCDFHPHPDCIYETEDGLMISEDEEDCPHTRNFSISYN